MYHPLIHRERENIFIVLAGMANTGSLY